jgi:putative sterol carrier protein
VIKINNGAIAVNPGQAPEPNLKLTMAASDYVAISKGEANPALLLKGGRLKAQGDIMLAMKFQGLFDRNRVKS